MEGDSKPNNYKGGIKPVNPNNRNDGIKYRGSTFAWTEDRDKRTGEITAKQRDNDPNIQRVYIREKSLIWSECPTNPYYGRRFTYYDVVKINSKGTEILGRWTEHTTDERRDSFFYRMFNPDHMSPFTFTAPVRFSGRSEDSIRSGATDTRTAYVTIPPEIVSRCDVRVDDEILFTVTNKEGDSLEGLYHISRMNRNDKHETKDGETCLPSFVIPFTKIKRSAYVDFPEDPVTHQPAHTELLYLRSGEYKKVYREHVSGVSSILLPWEYMGKKYDNLPEEKRTVLLPVRLFMAPGDSVTVSVVPHHQEKVPLRLLPYHAGQPGRFDFAEETLYQISKERKKDKLFNS